MKLTSLFLTLFFALSLVDFPAGGMLQPVAPKSCCCSAGKVCRCQHGSQTFCPMKRMKEQMAKMEGHAGCAMMRKQQHEADAMKMFLKEKETKGYPLFQAMGCGSAEEHKAAPSYSRDFNIYSAPSEFTPKKPDFFWGSEVLDPFQLFAYQLEKPPQLFSPR